MSNIELSSVLALSIEERLRLVESIWDSIAAHPEALALNEDERRELDRRWHAYLRDPEAGAPWSEVRTRIAAR
jgi:putative addiction module component (TIGR02574 family)